MQDQVADTGPLAVRTAPQTYAVVQESLRPRQKFDLSFRTLHSAASPVPSALGVSLALAVLHWAVLRSAVADCGCLELLAASVEQVVDVVIEYQFWFHFSETDVARRSETRTVQMRHEFAPELNQPAKAWVSPALATLEKVSVARLESLAAVQAAEWPFHKRLTDHTALGCQKKQVRVAFHLWAGLGLMR
jgi:hypothetical protein